MVFVIDFISKQNMIVADKNYRLLRTLAKKPSFA
jgi:hypothetical protein